MSLTQNILSFGTGVVVAKYLFSNFASEQVFVLINDFKTNNSYTEASFDAKYGITGIYKLLSELTKIKYADDNTIKNYLDYLADDGGSIQPPGLSIDNLINYTSDEFKKKLRDKFVNTENVFQKLLNLYEQCSLFLEKQKKLSLDTLKKFVNNANGTTDDDLKKLKEEVKKILISPYGLDNDVSLISFLPENLTAQNLCDGACQYFKD